MRVRAWGVGIGDCGDLGGPVGLVVNPGSESPRGSRRTASSTTSLPDTHGIGRGHSMKQPPDLRIIQTRMRPGLITRDGFLGSDRRALMEILDEDANTVAELGLTHRRIADRMEYFTEAGRKGLGTTVTVEDDFEVRVETVRGQLPCPWGHKGLFPKRNVFLRNLQTGDELLWTGLSMHLIGEHGFYEGKHSTFRIDPLAAKRTLGL